MSRGKRDQPPSHGVIRLNPDRWASGGRALGRLEGRVVMLAGAVPGDEVVARIRADRGRYVEAETIEVVRPSAGRRSPSCPIQSRCGGCPLMPVPEDAQREAKLAFVVDALARIGRVADPPVAPLTGPEPWLGYRHKIELALTRDDPDRVVLGYHRAESGSEIVDVAACAIADPRLNDLLDLVRSHFVDGPGRDDPALRGGVAWRVILRASITGADRLIALRGPSGAFPALEEFARMASAAGVTGVARIHAGTGRRGGATTETLAGEAWIHETILGTEFRVPAGVFLQVHPRAAETLGRHLLGAAGRPGSVLELYGGVGGFGLAFAQDGARVQIVEADPEAIACGLDAAARAGLGETRFIRGDVLAVLGELTAGRAPDLLVADPPRTGLGRGVAERLGLLRPRRIAMVTCDPATMARDVLSLRRLGYVLDRVVPFDLFPQTAHVEAIAWLSPAPAEG